MKNPNPLDHLIIEATGAAVGDVTRIENIMREEIFHSTLDWQTREQLVEGARKAYAQLGGNREFYEYGRASALAVFAQMRAGKEPSNQRAK